MDQQHDRAAVQQQRDAVDLHARRARGCRVVRDKPGRLRLRHQAVRRQRGGAQREPPRDRARRQRRDAVRFPDDGAAADRAVQPGLLLRAPDRQVLQPDVVDDGDRLYWQEGDGVWSAPIATPLTASACGTPVLLGRRGDRARRLAGGQQPRARGRRAATRAIRRLARGRAGPGPTWSAAPCRQPACPTKPTANRVLLGCGSRKLVLSNVAQRSGRVALSGAAATSFAGQKVTILFNGQAEGRDGDGRRQRRVRDDRAAAGAQAALEQQLALHRRPRQPALGRPQARATTECDVDQALGRQGHAERQDRDAARQADRAGHRRPSRSTAVRRRR